ncbi:MAG TPA: gliding motility-associated C-terminal domain-containing protein [Cyclobacteriaceae bacterium]|nr:gliding motility-associated C-terminal domain-containing protein [Cyclobacteriaceae bacterium]
MNRLGYTGLLIWASMKVIQAQNLVPNPDFEDFKRLPCKLNEYLVQDLLTDWFQPLPTTTDYWNTLGSDSCFLSPPVPDNRFRSGTGSAGLITAYYNAGNASEYKEYLEVKLKEPMQKNKFYAGEFYTRSRNTDFYENDLLVSNNLGLAFADSIVWDYRIGHPDHLLMKSYVMALDIVPADGQWHKVSNCFLADKDFEYLLIGNFQSVNSTVVSRQSYNYTEAVAYYFVDDVSVTPLGYDISNLKKEVAFCHDQIELAVNASVEGAIGYQWPDGSTGSVFVDKMREDHSIKVKIDFNECSYEHIFKIDFKPDIDLGPDTLLCNEESILLAPPYPASSLTWSDGSSDSSKHITTSGTYAVEVPGQCPVSDTIAVKFIDCPGFIPNVFTPNNNDDFNPVFEIENIRNKVWSLQVFNRWGDVVFQSKKYSNDWDGGTLPEGVYYYLLYSPELDKRLRGWVQLIRGSE